jgi:hypothetical protein
MIRPYKYKKRKKEKRRDEPMERLVREKDEIPLTGFVADLEASPEEERFARALRANNIGFAFQYEMEVLTSIPGEERIVDFVIGRLRQPVEVYGRIGHESESDKARDRIREIMINQEMRVRARPLLEVVWYYDLTDQVQAEAIVKERFSG